MAAAENDRGHLDLTFATSFVTTMAVAVAPAFVAFGFLVWSRPEPHPVLATIVSILLTAAAFAAGSKVWANQPESYGYSFADLMVWHWVRREWAEEKLVRNARMLGYDRQGRFVGKVEVSPERQLLAAREIGAALDAKSSYTINHAKRVEKHVREVAAALELSERETEELATAAALHDIGNIRVPESVIRKAGELTIEERSTIEGHVLLGAIMAFEAGGEAVVQGVRHHHERYDGKGYPSGLKGEQIPLYARIIGIAEAYDAMTSTRPYRQSLTQEQAVAVLRQEGDSQFDAHIVEVFATTLPEPLEIVERFPFLAWAQRQIHELTILFRRVGATAVGAAASTIAIALILGTAVLKPGVFDGRSNTPGNQVRPERRLIAQDNGSSSKDSTKIALAAAVDAGVIESDFVLGDDIQNGDRFEVQVLGERIKVDGEGDNGSTDGGNTDGGSTDGGNAGNGNGNGRGNGISRPGVNVDDVDVRGGGNNNTPNPTPSTGTTNPDPTVNDPGSSTPDRPGNSGNAPGHNKADKDAAKAERDAAKADRAADRAEAKADRDAAKADRAADRAEAKEDREEAKADRDTGKPADAGKPADTGKPADAGKPADTGKPDGWAESSDNASENSNAGGNSDSAPGNSGDKGSDAGSSDSGPGNSGNSNAGGNSDSGSSDSGSSDSSPGNSGNSNAGGNSDSGSSASGSSDGNNGGGNDDKDKGSEI